MSEGEKIVAVALLSQNDLDRLGSSLTRLFRLEDTHSFDGLLLAIDEADRRSERERGR